MALNQAHTDLLQVVATTHSVQYLRLINLLLFLLQNSFSSVFHMEYEELGEVLDVPKR